MKQKLNGTYLIGKQLKHSIYIHEKPAYMMSMSTVKNCSKTSKKQVEPIVKHMYNERLAKFAVNTLSNTQKEYGG